MIYITFKTQREALAAARENRQRRIDCGLPIDRQYVLTRSGFTIILRTDGSTLRTPGHITCGMWIDPCDLPCLVSD